MDRLALSLASDGCLHRLAAIDELDRQIAFLGLRETDLGRRGGARHACEQFARDRWQDALIEERDPHCRGVLLLGQGADADVLQRGFNAARAARTCRGFAVGRTIFEAPAAAWLAGSLDDAALVRATAQRYGALIDAWQHARNA